MHYQRNGVDLKIVTHSQPSTSNPEDSRSTVSTVEEEGDSEALRGGNYPRVDDKSSD